MVERTGSEVDRVLRALAHPVRRDILERLVLGERTVSELAEPFGISLQAVSQHVQVLERARLVQRTRRSRESHCRLSPEPLDEVRRLLSRLERYWGGRLASLDRWIEEEGEGDA